MRVRGCGQRPLFKYIGELNMKKGQLIEGVVERVEFPNKGIVVTEDGERAIVKNTIEPTNIIDTTNIILNL